MESLLRVMELQLAVAHLTLSLLTATPANAQILPQEAPIVARQAEVRELSYLASTSQKTASNRKLPEVFTRIARCESGNRQFKENGDVLVSRTNDVGRYQINLKAHGANAKKLGIDIYSEEGNETYALYLYNRDGLKPWKNSARCWS